MTNNVDDGGAAFPRPLSTDDHQQSCNVSFDQSGMTLRQWYAGMALQGLLATGADFHDKHGDGWDWHARAAFAMADSMIAEGKKR